jgi:hypothetical protein
VGLADQGQGQVGRVGQMSLLDLAQVGGQAGQVSLARRGQV